VPWAKLVDGWSMKGESSIAAKASARKWGFVFKLL
jgi:hypothetical protein